MTISIYIATQRNIGEFKNSCYKPIYVGAALLPKATLDCMNYQRDDTDDNISMKNKSFCELTALYWMWKNNESDIVGLMHYRRYLSTKKYCNRLDDILTEDDIQKKLEGYDIILPKKYCVYGKVIDQYSTGQYSKDLELAGDIIKKNYSDFYSDYIDIIHSDSLYICNMFIAKKDLVDQYCNWLFPILFELENEIDITEYSTSEKRVYGYIAERLFNVWIKHENLTILEEYMYNTEQTFFDRFKRSIHLFNYKVLRINVLKYMNNRRGKRNANI